MFETILTILIFGGLLFLMIRGGRGGHGGCCGMHGGHDHQDSQDKRKHHPVETGEVDSENARKQVGAHSSCH